MISKNTDNAIVIEKLASTFCSIVLEYIASANQPVELQKPWFAYGLAKHLLQNIDALYCDNSLCHEDLIDTLHTHSGKYIAALNDNKLLSDIASDFQSTVTKLESVLKQRHKLYKQGSSNDSKETRILSNLTTSAVAILKTLYAELSYNIENIEKLEAYSIVFNTPVNITQLSLLFDKLMLARELWVVDNAAPEKPGSFKLDFFANTAQIISEFNTNDPGTSFEKILELFVNNKVLEDFSNEKLTSLYDRLKNLDIHEAAIDIVLEKIHHESQFRYSYNRLTDSGYDLLKRFQTFDSIAQQIEAAEFLATESYLVRSATFIPELVAIVGKLSDVIKVLDLTKDEDLEIVIVRIKADLLHQRQEDSALYSMISSIKNTLETPTEPSLRKRYSEIDHFAQRVLTGRFKHLFVSFKNLLNDDPTDDKIFLNQTIVRRFAQEFSITNQSNSVAKLRLLAQERAEIASLLFEIDFVDIFNHENINNITSLDFKKQISGLNIKTPAEYVSAIIKVLVASCSASQLECLYRPLLQGNLTKTEGLLKREISNQIKQRTTLTKLVYSVLTGQKNEYDKLSSIKKNISHTLRKTEQQLDSTKDPQEIKELSDGNDSKE